MIIHSGAILTPGLGCYKQIHPIFLPSILHSVKIIKKYNKTILKTDYNLGVMWIGTQLPHPCLSAHKQNLQAVIGASLCWVFPSLALSLKRFAGRH